MKKAIVVGSSGQDGTILLDFLKKEGYDILGIGKSKTIGIGDVFVKYNSEIINILDSNKIDKLIENTTPDEVYYLAAYHNSSQDIMEDNNTLFDKSYDIHVKGYLILLESIKKFSPTTKIFYASSCLVFGGTETEIQNEDTIPCPNGIYGITKLDGMYLSKLYRDNYKILASAGILYNHESEYRLPKFVSMKIIQGAIDIKNGKSDKLIIGNLSAKVDRGYAYDYVEAMYKILQYKEGSDFIISSGEIHTVQELVEITFKYLGLDWIKYVIEDNKIIKRNLGLLYGDNTKIVNLTGWKPKHTFIQMIHKIIDSTIQTQKH